MDPYLLTALVTLAAYLAGGVPFGYLVARARGVDIFAQGSGNIGATNVGRVLGRRFGVLVFALDFAKGAVPAALALRAGALADPSWGPATAEVLGVAAGLAAFLGHLFPVYLRFRGGKGVATGAGVVAVLVPGPALAALLVWLAVVCGSRYVSLASVAAAAALCLFRLAETPDPLGGANLPVTVFCLLAAALVWLRHRANLARLLRGNENRLRETPAMNALTRTIHVLALGLWFGSVVFFTFFVGLPLFAGFEGLGERAERPAWFPPPRAYERRDPALDGPKEQGTRAAGFAVGRIFPYYFPLQGACGLLALGTALGLSRAHPGRVQRARTLALLLAVLTVLVAYPVEQRVNELREPRNRAVDAFLTGPSAAAREAALDARAEFVRWHALSLVLNFLTLILVTVAMALAARLPGPGERPAPATAEARAGAGVPPPGAALQSLEPAPARPGPPGA